MQQEGSIKLFSSSFTEGGIIPKQYSCVGKNINPSLSISDVPTGAKSLVLIVEDPDSPLSVWTHWLLWNISVETNVIEEGSLPLNSVQGLNDFKKNRYDGPCPPSGTHRYFFKLYALDTELNLPAMSKKNDLEKAMYGHILDQTELFGLFFK